MKTLILLLPLLLLVVVGCEGSLVSLGDKNIASCTFDEVYFVFDLHVQSVSAWNETSEEMWVRVEQDRQSGWFRVFDVNLRRRQDGGHHHTEEDVNFSEGDKFYLSVKKHDWQNPEKVLIRLERENGQLSVAFLPDTT